MDVAVRGMKTRNVLQEDFEFILKLTRRNMERIVTGEWNLGEGC